jgi:ubiquinone/menaquinone biosynthesis C-methylase UbiE
MADPVIDFFDGVAAVYDDVVPFFAAFGAAVAADLPRAADGAALLDVGAGRGAIALPAAALGYRVTAVDGAPAMAARLSGEHPELDVRVADAAELPFSDAAFDVVTSGFMLHIVPDPDAVLREFKRVLRPGGLVAFTVLGPVPAGFEPADASDELFAEFAQYLPADGGRTGAPFDERAALTAAGFRDVGTRDVRVELPLADPETLGRWYATHGAGRFLNALPDDRRAEFHRRLITDVSNRDEWVLRRYAWLWTAHT